MFPPPSSSFLILYGQASFRFVESCFFFFIYNTHNYINKSFTSRVNTPRFPPSQEILFDEPFLKNSPSTFFLDQLIARSPCEGGKTADVFFCREMEDQLSLHADAARRRGFLRLKTLLERKGKKSFFLCAHFLNYFYPSSSSSISDSELPPVASSSSSSSAVGRRLGDG